MVSVLWVHGQAMGVVTAVWPENFASFGRIMVRDLCGDAREIEVSGDLMFIEGVSAYVEAGPGTWLTWLLARDEMGLDWVLATGYGGWND